MALGVVEGVRAMVMNIVEHGHVGMVFEEEREVG